MQLLRTIVIVAFLLSSGAVIAEDGKSRLHGAEAKAAKLDVKVLRALDVALQKQVDDKHVSGVNGLIGRHGKIG